jgi:hypothetical protein
MVCHSPGLQHQRDELTLSCPVGILGLVILRKVITRGWKVVVKSRQQGKMLIIVRRTMLASRNRAASKDAQALHPETSLSFSGPAHVVLEGSDQRTCTLNMLWNFSGLTKHSANQESLSKRVSI